MTCSYTAGLKKATDREKAKWSEGSLLQIPWGGYSQKNLVGVCGPLPKTLSLFMTKICDFPYPIYDLTKNLIPYLWPDS